MLTKISIEGNRRCYAIVLENCGHYHEISTLQNALLWAIKTMAQDKYSCGTHTEIWEIVNLLCEMQPTEKQSDAIEKLSRADN